MKTRERLILKGGRKNGRSVFGMDRDPGEKRWALKQM